MTPDSGFLSGLRVMVVEDEMLVSLMIEDILAEQGCRVVGPFDRLPGALEAARSDALDFALLDVNIAGEMIYPVADVLVGRGIPFLFLSGYGENGPRGAHVGGPVCSKPFRVNELVDMIARRLEQG
jgi:DNA-binding response OmpR family regulator